VYGVPHVSNVQISKVTAMQATKRQDPDMNFVSFWINVGFKNTTHVMENVRVVCRASGRHSAGLPDGIRSAEMQPGSPISCT
jgi:hypothetical protein